MGIHIALLRGINVGGRNLLAMPDLRTMLGDLGFTAVTSLLQSGNLVFNVNGRSGAELERLLERETAARLDVTADYIVRTTAQLRATIAVNPFPTAAQHDPSHLLVMFLKAAPSASRMKALNAAIKGPETIASHGRQLYMVYPAGIGRSKLTGAVVERTLGCRGTARNWNTVLKLAALCR